MKPLELLYVAYEMAPFVKVGGLADVAGALPRELSQRGHRVRVALPVHPAVRRFWSALAPQAVGEVGLRLGTESHSATIHRAPIPASDVELLLIEYEPFFNRVDPYVDPQTGRGWPDSALAHTFFCRAVLGACRLINWAPDLIHLNDHQTALVAPLLREAHGRTPLRSSAVVFSVHNLGYQGIYPTVPEEETAVTLSAVQDAIGLDRELFAPGGAFEFYGRVNFVKAALHYADLITTVSPTYAREIREERLGFGLHEILRKRADRLVGILSGIDTKVWNPRTDPLIPHTYGPSDFRGKARNKERLLEAMHLPAGLESPLVGMISRLVDQKGLNLLRETWPGLLERGVARWVILGTGQPEYEQLVTELARQWPEQFAAVVGFDEALAHLIEAGSDFFLMPSRYEPCGLNQMYSLAYGTVPIVHATGGLKDTVSEFNPETGHGSGFVFDSYKPEALVAAVDRALAAYGRKRSFKSLVTRIMQIDHSWERAADEHERVYERAIELRKGKLSGKE